MEYSPSPGLQSSESDDSESTNHVLNPEIEMHEIEDQTQPQTESEVMERILTQLNEGLPPEGNTVFGKSGDSFIP